MKLTAVAILAVLLLTPPSLVQSADAPSPLKTAEPASPAKSPPKRWDEEPFMPQFSAVKAAMFLDAGARADEGSKCLNCHASFAYLMARPALPIQTAKHAEVRFAVAARQKAMTGSAPLSARPTRCWP